MATHGNKLLVPLLSFMIIASTSAALDPIPLGTAANYVILAQSGITTTGKTAIVGNLGLGPGASAAITGFALTLGSDGTDSSSSLVTGRVHAADYASPTPTALTTAVSDYTAAYNNGAGRTNPDFLDVGAGSVSGATLAPGLYKWNTAVTMGGTNTFSGSSTDVFIMQITGTLDFAPGSKVVLTGGVLPKNIFYVVSGQVTLGGDAAAQGIILGKTGIVFNAGATLVTGRALAATAVTMIGNTVTQP